jgi:hypothetical protein
MLAAFLRCGLTNAKQHPSFTISSVYLPDTRLIKPSFFKAASQIILICFPQDTSDVNVTPRYVTFSDVLMFTPSYDRTSECFPLSGCRWFVLFKYLIPLIASGVAVRRIFILAWHALCRLISLLKSMLYHLGSEFSPLNLSGITFSIPEKMIERNFAQTSSVRM